MTRTIVLVAGAAGLIGCMGGLLAGCLKDIQHRCADDSACTMGGVQGTCERVGFCSFPDPNCPHGRRYGELAESLSNQCTGDPPDAGVDAPAAIDAYVADARECFGAGDYELCFAGAPPMASLTLFGTFDTTSDGRCVAMPQSWSGAGQPDACMLVARDLSITGNLLVTGSRPLVLVGEFITIGAVLDIASHRGVAAAPGGNASECDAYSGSPVNSNTGAGGGAGGSFMTKGGDGGRGADVSSTGGLAAVIESSTPTTLRGGCSGQTGGTGTQAAGTAGAGGGAVYIAASRLSIPPAGAINASGAGALGGGTFSGGSGGGSGGMIVIHAYQVVLGGGRLVANGGGGASGGTISVVGSPGNDPSSVVPSTPANGGVGGGASGGRGFAGVMQAENALGAQTMNAGGGGGGGAGFIRANMMLPGITASPAITVIP